MPYISIQTNQSFDQSERQSLLKKVTAFAAELLGKSESKFMVHIDAGADMVFAGTDEPAAFVQLKSIGLPREKCSDYAAQISDFLERELKIPGNRAFIDFTDIDQGMFALNGKTFA